MTAIKWLVFLAGLCAAPAFGVFLRTRPRLLLLAWTALGLLPFLGEFDLGLIELPGFVGDTYGMEVTVVDFLALALLFSRPFSLKRVPYRLAIGAYLLVALFSVTQAVLTLPALLYSWRLLRFVVIFLAVVRGATSVPVVLAIVRGISIGVVYEFVLTMQQRLYVYQSPGSFGHQNSLGMAMNLVLFVPMALALARKTDWLTTLCPLLGLIVVILTRSRGALLFFVLGAALLFALSLLRRTTSRKTMVAVVGSILALAVLVRAAPKIIERFETAPQASMDSRVQYEEAASLMLRDHPLGIGANHYAWYLERQGYGAQVGLLYEGAVRALVHNVYWLTLAELGRQGLVALLVLFALPLVDAFRFAFRAPRGDVRADLLLGLGVGLLACYLSSLYEWIWRATDVSYIYWTVVGLVGALSAQVRRHGARTRMPPSERSRRRRAAASETSPEPEAAPEAPDDQLGRP